MPGFSKWSLSLNFPHQNPYVPYPLPHMCYIAIFLCCYIAVLLYCYIDTCPVCLISLNFITQAIFGADYRSWSSSLCSLLLSPVTSSLVDPNIFFSSLFWNTQTLFLPHCERPISTPIDKNRQNYSCMSSSLYFWIAKDDRVVAGSLILLLTSTAMQFWFLSLIRSVWFRVEDWKWLTKCLCHVINKPLCIQTYFERT